jgi:2,4-didehydro-3-deoxy-L-rhamnonate hydrolase
MAVRTKALSDQELNRENHMRLIAFADGGTTTVGRIEGDHVVPLGDRATFWKGNLAGGASAEGTSRPLAEVDLLPAIPETAKVICVGLNYRKHAEEGGMPIPEKPVIFARWAETLIADGTPSPAMEPAYDWEAELGVVIGKDGFAISEADALGHVFGYCTFNDLSCRALQFETAQWSLGKNSDRSGPIGAIVSADEAGNPADGWSVITDVNGERMQEGNTADFIFTVPQIIASISRAMTLRAGDLIITGTPSGVGVAMKPPRFLKPGDVVRVEVAGLGAVTTPIIARPEAVSGNNAHNQARV